MTSPLRLIFYLIRNIFAFIYECARVVIAKSYFVVFRCWRTDVINNRFDINLLEKINALIKQCVDRKRERDNGREREKESEKEKERARERDNERERLMRTFWLIGENLGVV